MSNKSEGQYMVYSLDSEEKLVYKILDTEKEYKDHLKNGWEDSPAKLAKKAK
jgi:hypothetical protein